MTPVFRPGNILLPKGGLPAWSVVACDQYTSDPGYWDEVERIVGKSPSALRIIFPEARLGAADFEDTIRAINRSMVSYLSSGVFREEPEGMIYVERTFPSGTVRRGIVGLLDLLQYDYQRGSQSLVRATEGTVLERIPPRVRIRRDAPLESPHVLVLIDDAERRVVEPLALRAPSLPKLYDFELMMGGGHIRGWRLSSEDCRRVTQGLESLGDPGAFQKKYGLGPGVPPMVCAVGDGNHSLAAAKECFSQVLRALGERAALAHPSRYALVELGNLHDDSLRFSPIHRAVFGAEEESFLKALQSWCGAADGPYPPQTFRLVTSRREEEFTVPHPSAKLAVGFVQEFLDQYLSQNGGTVDYIHGEREARRLASEGAVSILLDALQKEELFPAVLLEGALPRKTFSMGEAFEKRYYLECRRLK